MKKREIFLKGIWKENPILVLMIGLCPLLAVSTSAINGLGMGLAVIFVLAFSNLVISLLRKIISPAIRIPIFIVIISTFVTLIDYVMHAYLPSLHENLGVFVPLIVVNCIILGRAEGYAYKNKVIDSVLDGLGMGIGFTLLITFIGIIREILGNGTVFGSACFIPSPAIIMILPPGAFITIGTIMGIKNYFNQRKDKNKNE